VISINSIFVRSVPLTWACLLLPTNNTYFLVSYSKSLNNFVSWPIPSVPPQSYPRDSFTGPSYGLVTLRPKKELLILFALSIVATWSVEHEGSTLTVHIEFYHLPLEGHTIPIGVALTVFAYICLVCPLVISESSLNLQL
jgi:hypothetical protein